MKQSQEQKTEEDLTFMLKTACKIESLLDDLNDLETKEIYHQKLKYAGNNFKAELEKKIKAIYDLCDNEEAQLLLQSKVKEYQDKINKVEICCLS